jgi:hypothetical protein
MTLDADQRRALALPSESGDSRIDRLRRAHGQAGFTAAQITEFVRESLRNRSRLGFRQQRGHLVMTIQRAKNREFPNVVVLWPHTATGSAFIAIPKSKVVATQPRV